MLATRKDDGSPRRLVDLSPLNKYCKREVHTSKAPFNLAKSVPSNSVKTVVDAWNGYHAIPVKGSDRKYLTFATNLGLFRYMRAPQGFLSSGDGYNRRLDDLTSHIQRLERCVDQAINYQGNDNDRCPSFTPAQIGVNAITLAPKIGPALSPVLALVPALGPALGPVLVQLSLAKF